MTSSTPRASRPNSNETSEVIMARHTLSVLVEDKPGVLTRVTALFARRAFNIHSLAVGPTEHPDISRITVVVDADASPLEQVTKQLNKLVNVLKIVDLPADASVQRELLLVKVKADHASRTAGLQTVELPRPRRRRRARRGDDRSDRFPGQARSAARRARTVRDPRDREIRGRCHRARISVHG